MQLHSNDQHVLSNTINRRESLRSPPTVDPTFVFVTLGRDHVKAKLVDVSEGGLGVLVSKRPPFELGCRVRVDIRGKCRLGSVVYIQSMEPDGYRLGLSWES